MGNKVEKKTEHDVVEVPVVGPTLVRDLIVFSQNYYTILSTQNINKQSLGF